MLPIEIRFTDAASYNVETYEKYRTKLVLVDKFKCRAIARLASLDDKRFFVAVVGAGHPLLVVGAIGIPVVRFVDGVEHTI
jgi:hypothetical protein